LDEAIVAPVTETGSLGVVHVKRLWSATRATRAGRPDRREDEWHLDRLVIDALGLGLHQTLSFLHVNGPSFEEFESWIVNTAGRPEPALIERLNAEILGDPHPVATRRWLEAVEQDDPVLTPDDLRSWEERGYVVLHDAVPEDRRAAAERAIWEHVGADPDDVETWYGTTDHGIMVELIQHPALAANRRSSRIHRAFAQLWGDADLWASTDRCGFHPPQRDGHIFPGPDLHWDLDLQQPIAFGTQGLILTDTEPEQGALTLVPGFHHRLAQWLEELGDLDPHDQDLHALGSMPVGGSAGDMVIWHQALPHGSRQNLGDRPRIVQYLKMYPGRLRSDAA
jgi:hypothetical protein